MLKNKPEKQYPKKQLHPSVMVRLRKINHDVILDGEVVLLNEKNLPDFQKLQHYENYLNYPLIYYVFDMLQLDGKNIEHAPLEERKKLLEQLLKKNQTIRYSDHIDTSG